MFLPRENYAVLLMLRRIPSHYSIYNSHHDIGLLNRSSHDIFISSTRLCNICIKRYFCASSLCKLSGICFTKAPSSSAIILNCSSISNYSTGIKDKSNPTYFYDVLGISSKASQKQIRDAYYTLSKIHHPDISTDEKSSFKFSEISAAYEVLGNKRKRKIYDRGFMDSTSERPVNEGNFETQYYPGAFKKRAGTPPTGKSNIYDFDEFYRQHYGETITRNRQQKKQVEKDKLLDEEHQRNEIRGVFACGVIVVATGLLFLLK